MSQSLFSLGEKVCVKHIAELKAEFRNFRQGVGGGMIELPCGYNFNSHMEVNGGKICTITSVIEGEGYYLDNNSRWLYTDEMLRKVQQ